MAAYPYCQNKPVVFQSSLKNDKSFIKSANQPERDGAHHLQFNLENLANG